MRRPVESIAAITSPGQGFGLSEQSQRDASRTMGGHRVLVVEDHDSTRSLLERAFASRTWETLAVATVTEALRCLDAPPDCLILDLNLPDGHDETLLDRIQA
jgi:CheY-like chemotaxis protein